MKDEAIILLKEIKESLSIVIGTNNLPVEKQFSIEALNKAAKEFSKLRKDNNQWISGYDIPKYIKSAPYNNIGNFIREELQFSNIYTKGKSVYYYKKDIINLGNELKERNIDLARYMELKAEKERIEKAAPDKYLLRKAKKIQVGRYKIHPSLKDIEAKQKIKKPLSELQSKLDALMEEYNSGNLSEHIELLGENNAFYKDFSYYGLKDEFRKRLGRWIRAYQNVKFEISEHSIKRK